MTALKIALLVLAAFAMVTAAWANSRMLKRAREAGHRYWLINPMSTIEWLRGPEILIFLAAFAVLAASLFGAAALQ
jgi:hypothetical protein